MNKFFHPYHLVSESPWPLMCSLSLLVMMIGGLNFFFNNKIMLLFIGLFLLLFNMFQWWRDVTREGTFQGNHTYMVLKGLKLGMVLFILSEVMFFLSFFWCYFHMFLSPSFEIGDLWPPFSILVFNPYNIPLLNTLILLSSGFSITMCHYMILNSNYLLSVYSIFLTVFLGGLFIFFQYLEYSESFFCINDSVYGSIFFMITGFHGFHVIMGTLFIIIMYVRLMNNHFSLFHHFGFEASSWYWHFVDVVWLFLYMFIYWFSY